MVPVVALAAEDEECYQHTCVVVEVEVEFFRLTFGECRHRTDLTKAEYLERIVRANVADGGGVAGRRSLEAAEVNRTVSGGGFDATLEPGCET